jgi:hypothetical protein
MRQSSFKLFAVVTLSNGLEYKEQVGLVMRTYEGNSLRRGSHSDRLVELSRAVELGGQDTLYLSGFDWKN